MPRRRPDVMHTRIRTCAHHIHQTTRGLHLQKGKSRRKKHTRPGALEKVFIDTFHSRVMAKVLLQACSRIPGCPWCNPGGKGRDAETSVSGSRR